MLQKIILAAPRGPCAGVHRALSVVEMALEKYGAPIFVNHEIVHNSHVVQSFEEKGVLFGTPLDEIPEGSVFIFSAHGVSPAFSKKVESKNFITIDATCPLVTKVHEEAKKYAIAGFQILFIGHRGHPEVEGTSGVTKMTIIETAEEAQALEGENFGDAVACLTQTTLSVDETEKIMAVLKKKFPHLKTPKGSDICYATQNRQNAVKELAEKCDFIAVIGSAKSSNSNRLVDTAQKYCGGRDAINRVSTLIESPATDISQIPKDVKILGVTSGASVPEYLVEEFLAHFPGIPTETIHFEEENMRFALPKI
ncbi:MAG: 4-hydroxy-3-methylbut-2-enyl diphosphate reductase [Candidatus Peregrinibacteria bacterium]